MTALVLDEMYPPSLARELSAKGHDVVAALDLEVGLASRSDEDVLTWAARNRRCLVTENVRDFAPLSRVQAHCGIVLVSSVRYPRTGSGLARITAALDELLRTDSVPAPGTVTWLSG
jgi:predicted nuclease of predicted toxin-antitoxin system